ncbi:hypothetical protein [Yoonia sp.]|uniref:hypothetical protein n=1 Tax=Yoonia sp. TaxID=2212373 RepID=UPI00358DFDB3
MKTVSAATAFLLSTLATQSSAQDDVFPTYMPWGSVVGLTQNIKLHLNDDVDGNCWTNPNSVRSSAFLMFEQNDIFVPDYEPAFISYATPQATISAFGFRTNNGLCAVSANFVVQYGSSEVLGGADGKARFSFPTTVNIFENTAIFVNSSNVNEQLADYFEGQVSEFIARSISSRRTDEFDKYFELYPRSNERPMSMEEWEAMIEEMNAAQSE